VNVFDSTEGILEPRVHLIFTSLITNRPINLNLFGGVSTDLHRLDQFLSSIHSMALLPLESQVFYLELGEEFLQYRNLISDYTKNIFPNSILYWKRLSSYQDWLDASNRIPASTNLILLQSNFDHAYVNPSSRSFFETCQNLLAQEKRSIAEITHWPEALSEISSPWGELQNTRFHPKYFTRDTFLAVGTTLVRTEFFKEWWTSDFTGGARIVRPDNPFGPSVKFQKATLVIPQIELFRHLDGYSHVGIQNVFAQKLDPCCRIQMLNIRHSDWRRLNFSDLLNERDSFNVLPDVDQLIDKIPANILMVASAHRIDLRILSIIARRNSLFDLEGDIRSKIIWLLIKSRQNRKLLPRMVVERIFVKPLLKIFKVATNPRKSEFLSEIMSAGIVIGIKSWCIRITRRKVKKFLKSCERHLQALLS
jgi:hypothetical protein